MNIYRVTVQFEDGSSVSLDNLALDATLEARASLSRPYGKVIQGFPHYEIDNGFHGERREELADAVSAFVRREWR